MITWKANERDSTCIAEEVLLQTLQWRNGVVMTIKMH